MRRRGHVRCSRHARRSGPGGPYRRLRSGRIRAARRLALRHSETSPTTSPASRSPAPPTASSLVSRRAPPRSRPATLARRPSPPSFSSVEPLLRSPRSPSRKGPPGCRRKYLPRHLRQFLAAAWGQNADVAEPPVSGSVSPGSLVATCAAVQDDLAQRFSPASDLARRRKICPGSGAVAAAASGAGQELSPAGDQVVAGQCHKLGDGGSGAFPGLDEVADGFAQQRASWNVRTTPRERCPPPAAFERGTERREPLVIGDAGRSGDLGERWVRSSSLGLAPVRSMMALLTAARLRLFWCGLSVPVGKDRDLIIEKVVITDAAVEDPGALRRRSSRPARAAACAHRGCPLRR